MTFNNLYERFEDVQLGGHWEPEGCHPRHKLAIVIPYRDREEHLKVLLQNLIPFLQKQKASFRIFVVDQVCMTFISVFVKLRGTLVIIKDND